MKRSCKRTLSVLLTALMLLSLLPAGALAAGNISYVDETGAAQTASATQITASTRALTDGWYYVQGRVVIEDTLLVTGEAKLILCDGADLQVSSQDHRAALQVEGAITRTVDGEQTVTKTADSLTIYAQSAGTGKLTATAKDNEFNSGDGAGIGGRGSAIIDGTSYDAVSGGNITIHGGVIKATSAQGAGIGGGGGGLEVVESGIYSANLTNGGHSGKLRITGGSITATSVYGAAIGSGVSAFSGKTENDITISGGSIKANSTHGAGIGGGGGRYGFFAKGGTKTHFFEGIGGDGGKITITGGTIDASAIGGGSGGNGALNLDSAAEFVASGYQGGRGGNGGDVVISSGVVNTARIGGGRGGDGGSTIGMIMVVAAKGGNGGDGGSLRISGGSVRAGRVGGGVGGACGLALQNSFDGYEITAVGTAGSAGGGGSAITVTGGSLNADYVGGGNAGEGARGTVSGVAFNARGISDGGKGGDGGVGGSLSVSGGLVAAERLGFGGDGGAGGKGSQGGAGGKGGRGGSMHITGGNVTAASLGNGGKGGDGGSGSGSEATDKTGLAGNTGGNGTAIITGGSITDGKGGFPTIPTQPTDGVEAVYPNAMAFLQDGVPAVHAELLLTNTDVIPNNTFTAQADENGKLYLYTRQNSSFVSQRIPGNHNRAIDVVKTLSLMQGDENGNFNPLSFLTRAELATVISRALSGQHEAPDTSAFTSALTDIDGQWYEGYVKHLEQQGLIDGYQNEAGALVFGGDEPATLAQAMKLVLGTAGYDAEKYQLTGSGWEANVRQLAAKTRADDCISASLESATSLYRSEMAQLLFNSLGIPVESGETYAKTALDMPFTLALTPAHQRYQGRGLGGADSSPIDLLPALESYGHQQGKAPDALRVSVAYMAVKENQTMKLRLIGARGSCEAEALTVSGAQYHAGEATAVFEGDGLQTLLPGTYQLLAELYEGDTLLSVFAGSAQNGQQYLVSAPTTSGGGGGGGSGQTPTIRGDAAFTLSYPYTAEDGKKQYTISGSGPITLTLNDPDSTGASIDEDGWLRIPASLSPGSYTVEISATNRYGTTTKTVAVTVGELSGSFTLDRLGDASENTSLVLTDASTPGGNDLPSGTYVAPADVIAELKEAKTAADANAAAVHVRMDNGAVILLDVTDSLTLAGDFPSATASVSVDKLTGHVEVEVSGTVRQIQVMNTSSSNTPAPNNVTLALSGTVTDGGVYLDPDRCTGKITLIMTEDAVIESEVRYDGNVTIDVTAFTDRSAGFKIRRPSATNDTGTVTILGDEAHLVNCGGAIGDSTEAVFGSGIGTGAVGIAHTAGSGVGGVVNTVAGTCEVWSNTQNFEITILPPTRPPTP